ncbi:MAG: putative glycosyltransferase [Luteibacter sp.]|uniref:glycosyltransferase family 2 protein n=1 Tax=Luteibacter sp. TaxID=1886636 RepID=UPI00138284ED|nr:glycosyltransferase family 2 protein [Luteibacter sp.]KAF1008011.1 MAG: putative glycosyltransferase [Luteibacter sp.]
MNALPLISIAIPVFNEEGNIEALYARLDALAHSLANECELEFVFSDNCSTDSTWSMLEALAAKDQRIRAIRFSKNFGFQRSILANYLHTRGDAVLQIDADLQDPPELLKEFLALWKQGYHVVYGVRRARPEGKLIHSFRKVGYWFIDRISEHPIPRNAGDFRLVDRKVIQALAEQRSAEPYLRGLIAGMGFRQIGLTYDRAAHVAGSSKFGVAQLIRLGLTGVFNHSLIPLRLATVAGIAILSLSAIGAIYYLVLKLIFPDLPRGLASLHILILFGIGFQSLLLGILGEYLLRIYRILRREPIAIVQDALNLAPNDIKL